MTQLNQLSPYHRHVDYEVGHIVHANPVTGEVIAQSAMVRARNPEEKYQAWAAERRADDLLVSDHSSTATYEPAPVAPDVGAPKSAKAGRGRPKTSFANPVAAYMYLLAVPDLLPWVEHIITGSIITSAASRSSLTIGLTCRCLVPRVRRMPCITRLTASLRAGDFRFFSR